MYESLGDNGATGVNRSPHARLKKMCASAVARGAVEIVGTGNLADEARIGCCSVCAF